MFLGSIIESPFHFLDLIVLSWLLSGSQDKWARYQLNFDVVSLCLVLLTYETFIYWNLKVKLEIHLIQFNTFECDVNWERY